MDEKFAQVEKISRGQTIGMADVKFSKSTHSSTGKVLSGHRELINMYILRDSPTCSHLQYPVTGILEVHPLALGGYGVEHEVT